MRKNSDSAISRFLKDQGMGEKDTRKNDESPRSGIQAKKNYRGQADHQLKPKMQRSTRDEQAAKRARSYEK